MLSQRRQILTPKHSGSDNTTSVRMPSPLPLSLENSPGLLRPPDKE